VTEVDMSPVAIAQTTELHGSAVKTRLLSSGTIDPTVLQRPNTALYVTKDHQSVPL
jgi:hypothetical protein